MYITITYLQKCRNIRHAQQLLLTIHMDNQRWSIIDHQIILTVTEGENINTFTVTQQQEAPFESLIALYEEGTVLVDQKKLILQDREISLIPISSQPQEHKQQVQADQKKQEEPFEKHRRECSKKKGEKKRKQKRIRKKIQESDPRYRGVPKLKRITKRKNKPKVISQEAKKEAQQKRQEEEYYSKINNRGKISLSNIKRRQKTYFKSKKQCAAKIEEDQVKLEQQSHLSCLGSQSQGESKDTVPERQIKRRVSRKQRQREREQDQSKVDTLMKGKSEKERREQIENMVRMQRQMQAKYGEKVILEFDPNCKYYSQYKCKRGQVDKIGRLYCQIYNKHSIPPKGRHFFHLKIVRLTYQSITVGLISQSNFQNQYSRDKTHCVCFDAYTHSIYVQGQKQQLEVQVKLGDIVRTVVQMQKGSVQWYINNELIGIATLPVHMRQSALYPYLQISNKWIKLRVNDFQE